MLLVVLECNNVVGERIGFKDDLVVLGKLQLT